MEQTKPNTAKYDSSRSFVAYEVDHRSYLEVQFKANKIRSFWKVFLHTKK